MPDRDQEGLPLSDAIRRFADPDQWRRYDQAATAARGRVRTRLMYVGGEPIAGWGEDLRRQINRAASLIAREEVGTRVRAATPFAILLVAGELAKALEVVPPAAGIRAAVLWAWERYLGSSEAIALDPAEQTVSHLRTWIAERWDVTVKSVDAAWDDVDGRRLNNRETLAWYDADTVYVPATRLREAAGNVLTEREIAQALDQRSLLARRSDARRIAVRRVPNVGRIDAYALRRDQFGRPALGAGPDLQVHEGGLR